jgi:thiamine biosynthesis protein ThiS
MKIHIQLNGDSREISASSSIAELVESIGLAPDQVAVELNRELVPRDRRTSTPLREGDTVELVTLVGGG